MNIDIHKDKSKRCFNKDGDYHNSYGPDETECDGYKTYFINGGAHNLHGPAIIYPTGKEEYYLNSVKYSKEYWKIKRHEY